MMFLRNAFFLIIAMVLATIGIKFCGYGLLVSLQGNSLYELPLSEVGPEALNTHRYIKITGARSVNPLVLRNKAGVPTAYIYPLLDTASTKDGPPVCKILLESKERITDWDKREMKGFLKPYLYKIDAAHIQYFNTRNIPIDPDAYYLRLDMKPMKWYQYLPLLALAIWFL
ncbi:MAG: hypothetical protein AAFV25_23670, partial [Bacteroidota bacterium]